MSTSNGILGNFYAVTSILYKLCDLFNAILSRALQCDELSNQVTMKLNGDF